MEYTIKELAEKWKVSLRTARRRIEHAGYKTEIRTVLVEQNQHVTFVTIEDING